MKSAGLSLKFRSLVIAIRSYLSGEKRLYFDLKEENAMLSCVKFGAGDLHIKNGDLLTVTGKVNFYVKSGRLNFIVSKTQAYGLGDLYQRFLMLKDKLEKEGLFSEEIKKPIPKFSKRIGVVTSETGAVIRDIINVTKSKNPYTDIVLYPSKVQGVGAEDELARGIEYFNTRDDIDVIIVGRGGGSLEDLAPFNTEKIVRAIYHSQKPIISAVGHETDFSLCDFAADLRVPTPSVAAEVAVFDYFEQVRNIQMIAENNYYNITKMLKNKKAELKSVNEVVSANLKVKTTSFYSVVKSAVKDIQALVESKRQRLAGEFNLVTGVISKLNPLEILKNGYSIIEKDNKRVATVENLAVGDNVTINLSNGKVDAEIKSVKKG